MFHTGNAKRVILRATLAATLLGGAMGAACAQSSVTLYGLLSVGVTYTNNQGGNHLYQLQNGPQQLPRFGFKGSEDLGGGSKAIFLLENGFSLTTGALGQGGLLFGRQAYVGYSSNNLGTLTAGRQYEEMAQQLFWYESGTLYATYGTHIGDNDNIFNTFRFNNSVRYLSPQFGPVQVSGSYAFSNKAGGFSDNNGYSAGLSFATGPVKANAAFTLINFPGDTANPTGAVDPSGYGFSSPFVHGPGPGAASVHQQSIYGAGGSYAFGTITAALLYTHSHFLYRDNTTLNLNNVEISARDFITPDIALGAGYIITYGEYSQNGKHPQYQQVNLSADYFFSKRTDVYLVGVYQKAGRDAKFAQIYTFSPSSTNAQVGVTAGIRTKF
jgi:general bacterial porin, GBP family